MKIYMIAIGSVFIAALAQTVLKLVAVSGKAPLGVLRDGRFYLGGVLLVLAFIGWMVAASRIEFSRLIPLNALTLAISGVIGVWVFDEVITVSTLCAYALITAGIVVLTLGR